MLLYKDNNQNCNHYRKDGKMVKTNILFLHPKRYLHFVNALEFKNEILVFTNFTSLVLVFAIIALLVIIFISK